MMKMKVSDVPLGGCFRAKNGKSVKKTQDGRCARKDKKGRIRVGKCPSGEAETVICPVSLLGAGLAGGVRVVEVGGAPAGLSGRRRKK